jgi:hypothetical protein
MMLRIITAILFPLCLPVMAQSDIQPVTLSVLVTGALPGFRAADAAPYIAQKMAATDLPEWRFTAGNATAPDRVEWNASPDAYASSDVRQFFPMPQMQKLFGDRRRVTVEARLYLGGQYQTLMLGQATIRGGASDEDLASFIARMTEDLLGGHGAYNAIDLAPLEHPP